MISGTGFIIGAIIVAAACAAAIASVTMYVYPQWVADREGKLRATAPNVFQHVY
jgi:hypothetical protein